MSLLLALAAGSFAHADSMTEVRRIDNEVRHVRIDIDMGEVAVVRDASLKEVEVFTTPIDWDETCDLEIHGSLRTRIYVKRPFLPRADCAVSLEVRLPPGIGLTVDMGEGDVALNGLVNDAKIVVDNGNLTLMDVRGDVDINMKSGTVKGTHSSQQVDLALTNEKVTLEGVSMMATEVVDSSEDAG